MIHKPLSIQGLTTGPIREGGLCHPIPSPARGTLLPKSRDRASESRREHSTWSKHYVGQRSAQPTHKAHGSAHSNETDETRRDEQKEGQEREKRSSIVHFPFCIPTLLCFLRIVFCPCDPIRGSTDECRGPQTLLVLQGRLVHDYLLSTAQKSARPTAVTVCTTVLYSRGRLPGRVVVLPALGRVDPLPHPQGGYPLGTLDDRAAGVPCAAVVGPVVGAKVREECRL